MIVISKENICLLVIVIGVRECEDREPNLNISDCEDCFKVALEEVFRDFNFKYEEK